ncbi:lipoprotein insertase outer membrane protein LolB [Halomonas sp. YLGW01]|uniref:lipoprotein insertase outer membrane protein LolB n=1 Tax=Halomonas sp. YLGW01 TaxID=2773308 RepID=UPI0017851A66|nr:lipoprotein insertase outer membrane protein LolB [Halomonas sp. YLGW01]
MTRRFIVLIALALLAGCAARAPAPTGSAERGPWQDQVDRLEALSSWTLAGKVGLRTPDENTSANLDWRQRPHYYRLLISGPFGAGRTTLEGTAQEVTLTNGEGRLSANSAEALLEQALGWSLPVSSLDHWIRGLPAPEGNVEREVDALGYPTRLIQSGWTIDYGGWMPAGDLWLPRRLDMQRPGIEATLLITIWQPETERD